MQRNVGALVAGERVDPALPPVTTLAANVAGALVRNAMGLLKGKLLVSEEEAEKRLAVCVGCRWFRRVDARCAHPRCGCYSGVKVHLNEEQCPEAKWASVTLDPVIPSP